MLMGGGILLISFWTAGLFFTRIGRRMLIGSIVAVVISAVAFPDAIRACGAGSPTRKRRGAATC